MRILFYWGFINTVSRQLLTKKTKEMINEISGNIFPFINNDGPCSISYSVKDREINIFVTHFIEYTCEQVKRNEGIYGLKKTMILY